MSLDITTNRRASSLAGVNDATILQEYAFQGIQQAYKASNKFSQFATDVSDKMRDVQSATILRNRTVLPVTRDMSATGNTMVWKTANRGSPSIDEVRIAWTDKNRFDTSSDYTMQQGAEAPVEFATLTSMAIVQDTAAAHDIYMEAAMAGDLSGLDSGNFTSGEVSLFANLLDTVDYLDGTTSATRSIKHNDSIGTVGTNFIDSVSGDITGDDDLLYDMLDAMDTLLGRLHLVGDSAPANLQFRVVMPRQFRKALIRGLQDKGMDKLFFDYINGNLKSSWFGNMQIVESSRNKERSIDTSTLKPVTSGGTKATPVYFIGTSAGEANAAFVWGRRHEVLQYAPPMGPNQNQAGAYHKWDYVDQTQIWPVNPILFFRRWVWGE